jgi:hypothetical protein
VGQEIVEQGLVKVASDWMEVTNLLIESLEKPLPHDKVHEAASIYLKDRQGGTAKACHAITELLDDTHENTGKIVL